MKVDFQIWEIWNSSNSQSPINDVLIKKKFFFILSSGALNLLLQKETSGAHLQEDMAKGELRAIA